MSACTHPAHQHCSFCDPNGRLTVKVDGNGEPELRTPFANEAVIHMAKPMIEGFVEGNEWEWQLSADRVTPIVFTLEEFA